jgi:hypothetical protein
MTMHPIKWVAGISMIIALAVGTCLPAASQGQVQAVPRAGLSFPSTITVLAKIESIDTDTRTVAFTTSDGRLLNVAVSDGVKNLDAIADGSMANVTYNEVVTILNLRQKGPGSKEARREGANPGVSEIESGRFTLTVTAVDLAKNTVSVIDGRGGMVHTYSADTPAKQEMLKKTKVGDVVIGLTTPLLVTAISPAR